VVVEALSEVDVGMFDGERVLLLGVERKLPIESLGVDRGVGRGGLTERWRRSRRWVDWVW
jgi:hypothetical protein